MKLYYLLFSIILSSCSVFISPQPKFHMGQCVMFINSFYDHCGGAITNYDYDGLYYTVRYTCSGKSPENVEYFIGPINGHFHEEELKDCN